MSVPSFSSFLEPLLRYLIDQQEAVRNRDAYEAMAAEFGLTEEQRVEMIPSGSIPVYKNRIGWALDRLKRAGLANNPRRGYWQVTDKGREFVEEHPAPLSKEDVRLISNVDTSIPLSEHTPTTCDDESNIQASTDEHESPQERIEKAIVELNDSVGAELLDLIMVASPLFFEALVLDLLHAVGYGTSKSDLQRVGGSGDGGIDGIISLDKLGLEKVYVQAKRWQANVGRPELQSFFGALAGRKANKGVFITTSGFTREAREFATAVSDSIVLVNGARLTELMIEHGVGVSHKALKIAKVDSDYFEEG